MVERRQRTSFVIHFFFVSWYAATMIPPFFVCALSTMLDVFESKVLAPFICVAFFFLYELW